MNLDVLVILEKDGAVINRFGGSSEGLTPPAEDKIAILDQAVLDMSMLA